VKWVVKATPRPFYPRERPGTHCIGGWVGPRAGLDGGGKISLPPGFDPRTVQPVASRYTDCAIPALQSSSQTSSFLSTTVHYTNNWSWYKLPVKFKINKHRVTDKSLARPGRKQANVSVRMAWISFGVLPCRKRNLIIVRVSILLKSRASLTCFRACFLPGRAKDISAPRYYNTDFFFYMTDWNTRTSNFWLCSEIPVMWIGFKPQISVCSKCVSKPIWCVHPEGTHLQTNVCIRNSHDNVYACFRGRHFSFLLTVVMESQMTYATRNSAEDSRTGSLRFMRIARRKCPRACASSDIHFRRRHDLLKPCEKGHRRSVRLVNHLCVAVRGNYSSQLSIRDPNVMNHKKSPVVTLQTRLTLKNYTNVMRLMRLTNVIFIWTDHFEKVTREFLMGVIPLCIVNYLMY